MLVLFPFFVNILLNDFKSDSQGLNLSSQSKKSLVNFSFKVHLDSFFSIVDSLNSPTNLTNLIEAKHTFWCFTTASKLSPMRSTSFRCSRSRSTSSRHRAESSICPFYPKTAACLIISSMSLSIERILSRTCRGLSVERLFFPSIVDRFFLVFCSTSCNLLSIQAMHSFMYCFSNSFLATSLSNIVLR